jgi:hypothetical protein
MNLISAGSISLDGTFKSVVFLLYNIMHEIMLVFGLTGIFAPLNYYFNG